MLSLAYGTVTFEIIICHQNASFTHWRIRTSCILGGSIVYVLYNLQLMPHNVNERMVPTFHDRRMRACDGYGTLNSLWLRNQMPVLLLSN